MWSTRACHTDDSGGVSTTRKIAAPEPKKKKEREIEGERERLGVTGHARTKAVFNLGFTAHAGVAEGIRDPLQGSKKSIVRQAARKL